ncbi:ribonuclease YeeF family protein [Listeria kieliensis]
MKDVHYQEDDFEKAEKSIGSLIGKGAWGKGAIDSLKDVSKNLEEVEKDIARLDADGTISFSHTDNKHKLQELYEDFEVLHDFAGEAGELVNDKIDQPFYEALDEFVEGMRDLDASKFTTKNRIGATKTVTTYANSYTQEQIEVPKKEVSLDDLFSGDNYYADQMKVQYEEWKRQNKDQDVSQKDFRSAMINSRAFEYTSIKDEQQKKEFWVNVVATVAIVGVSIFCPPAGLALGLAYGGLEMSAAVSGKDWLTGRELDTSERAMRGAFSLLDIVPGMKAFSGGTQAIRSGTKLASLSDNLLHGVKSIPSKADDFLKLGQKSALTRINSLKTTVKEGIHTGIERTTKGLDKVGEVADNFKNNLNLNSRRQLAADGFGALPAGGTSKVTNATEKMKDVLRKYDLNLSSGRRGADDIIKVGSKDIKDLRKKWNVPQSETIAVAKTDVPGLENLRLEGGSPKVRKEAGLPDLDVAFPNRNIKAPAENPLFTRHAEEDILNQFDRAIGNLEVDPQQIKGTLYLRQSNPSGVCKRCIQGLANDKVEAGVLKQLSLKYPNLTIKVTSELDEAVKVSGRANFIVQNGKYID